MKKILHLIVVMAATTVLHAAPPLDRVLFEEDFENGFNADWKAVSPDIEIVPEDPADPDGNQVVRLTNRGQILAGPWVKPRDWRTAEELADKLETWDDYELSFRFRIAHIPKLLKSPPRTRGGIFRIYWRVNPVEENPGESYHLEFRWNHRDGNWSLQGPLISWDGRDENPSTLDEMGPAGGKVDDTWHTFKLTVQGDTMTTMFDGDFHKRVRDVRIPHGVIAFNTMWGSRIDPGYVELDDIRVTAISDPDKGPRLTAEQRLHAGLARGCLFAYYPSRNEIYTTFDFSRSRIYDRRAVALAQTFTAATVQVRSSSNTVAETRVPLSGGSSAETRLHVPRLTPDTKIRFTLEGPDKTVTVEKPLPREYFPWEENTLGITPKIYPPFTPVEIEDKTVKVVQRQLEMNGFGLWDSAISQGRELLAAPMTLNAITADGDVMAWNHSVKLAEHTPQKAVFQGMASSKTIRVESRSTVEFDGCMKIKMSMEPLNDPLKIERLWLDIPLRDREMPLFHAYVDGIRINQAGSTPPGDGVIWRSNDAKRRSDWQNSFCPYIWLGAEERGLAWFAENDRGWLTVKDDRKIPVQEIIREGDRLTLRVYLVNHPAVLNERREMVFGLQASPVKPMPENWRARSDAMPVISGPVNPWGGLSCSYKGPYQGDWSVVDRICAAHFTNDLDEEWLAAYVAEHNPPPVQGRWPWADSIRKFVDKWAVPRRPRPAFVYAEEMAACTLQRPWCAFQDEWTISNEYTQRKCRSDEEFHKGPTPSSARSNFCHSYQDYALWYHNEWLKRGVSLYWDNSHSVASKSLRNSAAYVTGTGTIQPATNIWNQREYMRRTWNLLQYWKRHQPHIVEWSIHRTNSQILPLHGWATVSLDLEWSARYRKPFPPDEIRTTVMGLQTGVFGHDHRALFGKINPTMLEYAEDHPLWPGRASWGMRMVHEISRRSRVTPGFAPEAAEALEQIMVDFGYGTKDVTVHNYWAENPVLKLDNDQVKWLALADPADQKMLIVLASWAEDEVPLRITLDRRALGFTPAVAFDAESGEKVATIDDGTLHVTMPPVYGVRVLEIK
ncbi:MAG: DUF6067 family protein [Kiritimatiellales bacterium]|nr:DUF6067 family protein [Kiritimatiellales bacterium]